MKIFDTLAGFPTGVENMGGAVLPPPLGWGALQNLSQYMG